MAEIGDGWVLFLLDGQQYGLSIKNLKQMVVLGEVLEPPTYSKSLRGFISLRGRSVPVLNLRQRLGMKSSDTEKSELVQLFIQRKQDHIHWLDELYHSVEEERAFTLATDPHKCAFGKWHDSYKSSNAALSAHLQRFTSPHQRIHSIAKRVEVLVRDGKKAEAHELIEHTRNGDLAEMMQIFDEVTQFLRSAVREVVLVTESAGEHCGFLVDEVCSVRDIPSESIQVVEGSGHNASGISSVGVTDVDGLTTVFLDADELAQCLQAS